MISQNEVLPITEAALTLEKLLKKQEVVGKPRGCDDTAWQESND